MQDAKEIISNDQQSILSGEGIHVEKYNLPMKEDILLFMSETEKSYPYKTYKDIYYNLKNNYRLKKQIKNESLKRETRKFVNKLIINGALIRFRNCPHKKCLKPFPPKKKIPPKCPHCGYIIFSKLLYVSDKREWGFHILKLADDQKIYIKGLFSNLKKRLNKVDWI